MSRENDQGFEDLFSDVLSVEECDPELVVRFDEDPGSLTPAERAEVEAYLAASPMNRDALAAMRNIAEQGLLDLPAAEETPGTEAPPPAPIDLAAEREKRHFLREWALPIAALAAALAGVYFVALGPQDRAPDPESPIAQAPRQTPREEAPRDVLPQPQQELVAQQSPSTSEVEPQPSAEPTTTPEMIAQDEPREMEPSPQPAPEPMIAQQRPSPPSSNEAPPVEPGLLPPPDQEVVLLAMVSPEYIAPTSVNLDRMIGAMRNEGGFVAPQAISPSHHGLTSQPQPDLYWHLASLPPEPREFQLTIANEQDDEPLVDVTLASPQQAGRQRISLADLASLEAGKDYMWTVALRVDPTRPSQDLIAFGWVRYQPMSSEQSEAVASASSQERPAVQAKLGYFYDAFAELAALDRQLPDNASIDAALTALTEQAGLDLPNTSNQPTRR